jgi:hypothetical protein
MENSAYTLNSHTSNLPQCPESERQCCRAQVCCQTCLHHRESLVLSHYCCCDVRYFLTFSPAKHQASFYVLRKEQ